MRRIQPDRELSEHRAADAGSAVNRPTLAAVGVACGVSAATVSRAFSRPELISDAVRERVLATAAQMGYRPNKLARGLATGRSGRIGLLVPDVVNPFFAELLRVVQHVASSAAGCSVLIVDSDERPADEGELIAGLCDEVDGVILASPRTSARSLREALGSVPCVLINRPVTGSDVVTCAYDSALVDAGDHLLAAGHRRIAMVRGPAASWAATRRASALRRWAERAGVTLVDLGPQLATFDGGQRSVAGIIASRATAVVAYDDMVACGVIAGLHELGRGVPRDISVVGCDDTLVAQILTPALTTIRPPYAEIGEAAVTLLGQRIADPGRPPQSVALPCTLIVRESTTGAATRRRGE